MTVYAGGKQAIGKEIAQIINNMNPRGQMPYWEPFVGMCGVMQHVDARQRSGSDSHEEVIEMWRALQQGWIPPKTCTEKQYLSVKNNPKANKALRAFWGHGLSYGGTYFGAFRPNYSEYDKGAAGRAWRGVMKVLPKVQNVDFFTAGYDEVDVPKTTRGIIYCDPPYAGTQKVGKRDSDAFDSKKFWDWVRKMSKHHIVLVSEQSAPKDFVSIWEKDRHLKISNNAARQNYLTEHLFIHKSLRDR
jgi:DNA adenine methylase